MRAYYVADLCLDIPCQDETLGNKVERAFTNLLCLERAESHPAASDISLSFRRDTDTAGLRVPENAREIYSSPNLRVSTNDEISCLFAKGAYFHLNLVTAAGTAFIDDDFWDNPLKIVQECIVLSLLWLLHPRSIYSIHANCLERDGKGVLLVGTSGSGKSTAGFSLIRRGWHYLSDDVNLVRSGSGKLEILAFQKGYSIDPDMAHHYPEVRPYLDAAPTNGRKKILDMGLIYPDRFTKRTVPGMILFPRIVSQEESTLIPIDETTALVHLAENSGGIMVNRSMAAVQMDTLKRLVYQTSCYQLMCGRDVIESPEDFVNILLPLL